MPFSFSNQSHRNVFQTICNYFLTDTIIKERQYSPLFKTNYCPRLRSRVRHFKEHGMLCHASPRKELFRKIHSRFFLRYYVYKLPMKCIETKIRSH